MKPNVLCIVGPTSSGKTSLALKIAEHLQQCAIFSVDSRQAYKDLSILTGKDIPSQMPQNISFNGTDLLDPGETGNVAEFVRETVPQITAYLKKNIPVILVGGSGLYLKALTGELSDIGVPPDVKLRKDLVSLSLNELQEELKSIDNVRFNKLNNSDKNNPRRLIRHIEKLKTKSNVTSSEKLDANFIWVGLSLSKQSQISKIKDRIEKRLEQGVINEVSQFLTQYPKTNRPLFTSLGFKEISYYLSNDLTMGEMKEKWLKSEVDYARRQMVWFKKQPGIIWYDESIDKNKLAAMLAETWKKQ